MKTFSQWAEHDGFPLNPNLPEDFGFTPNDERPEDHQKWWNQPYITSETVDEYELHVRKNNDRLLRENPDIASSNIDATVKERRESWLKNWPDGVRYDVYCLDGGAHDRPTSWGTFASLEKAIECCRLGPEWRRS